jgi:glycine hydroxymethyltransferase
MAVFFSVLNPGDTILGMSLDHGGHLSHGAPVNFSGFLYKAVTYGVNKEGYIDHDEVRRIAKKYNPRLINTLIGSKATFTFQTLPSSSYNITVFARSRIDHLIIQISTKRTFHKLVDRKFLTERENTILKRIDLSFVL